MKRFSTARPNAAASVLIQRDGKYLFVRRAHTNWMDEHYGLPAGKVERGEGFKAAAIREAKEEVGVTIAPKNLRHAVTLWRMGDEPGMEWCDVVFVAESWQGEPYNAEPASHNEIAWFSTDLLPANVIPSVKRIIELFESGITYGEHEENIAK